MIIGVLLMMVFGGHGLARAGEPYPLGVALDLTQTGAQYAHEALAAIELAVAEINSQGGLLGQHPIELYVADTRGNPDAAAAAVMQFIQMYKVRCVIGTYSSASALAIKPICRQHKVLHIATISNLEDITKLDFSPYTFSVVPNSYMMAKGVVLGAAQLARKKRWTTFATIATDSPWGRASQSAQVALLGLLAPDLNLIGEYWPGVGETRFNYILAALAGPKPDFALTSIKGADNGHWLRDAGAQGSGNEITYPGSLISGTELAEQAGNLQRGWYGRCRAPFLAHPDEPMMVRLVEAFNANKGHYPSDWAVMSYDGVHALRQGVEKAGKINGEAVMKALKGAAIDTTRGRLFFRKIDNQLSCSAYFGRIADDPRYTIPIYKDLLEMRGPDIWRSAHEIEQARQAQPTPP